MSPLHLVVVDDVVRIALHACHMLGGECSLGVGDLGPGDGRTFWEDGSCRSYRSPSGLFEVWWVPVDETWRDRLTAVLRQLVDQSRALFLIDRRPSPGASGYSVATVVQRLHAQKGAAWYRDEPKDYCQLISSYGTGIEEIEFRPDGRRLTLPVRAKSPELFYRIARKHGLHVRRATHAMESCHVLVTGAGFDLARESADGRWGIGMPGTERLLRDVENHLPQDVGAFTAIRATLASNYAGGVGLDDLMNRVLEELQRTAEHPGLTKRDLEVALRSAFRDSVRLYDFGVTSQVLNAAQIPFVAWLTTNYTHYADRAISMLEETHAFRKGRRDGGGLSRNWTVVSTLDEAEAVRESIEQQALRSDTSLPRHLFKLHGDVGHSTSMAIAGMDKEEAPLSRGKIGGYRSIYRAAEAYLSHVGLHSPGIVWHVVGHGLMDKSLLNTMSIVRKNRHEVPQRYVIANGSDEASQQARDLLCSRIPEAEVRICGESADRYVWRLYAEGLEPARA